MNLFLSTSFSEIYFDLIDLIEILEDLLGSKNIMFHLFDYEYNGVKDNSKSVNQDIIAFLDKHSKDSIKINLEDFKSFAKCIEQTENGSFQVLSNKEEIILDINVYDSFYWNMASEDVKILNSILNHSTISCFNTEMKNTQ